MISRIQAFEGGSCRQLLAMVDRRSLRLVSFQAVFLALRHEREGWILIDTGYGRGFRTATRRFPHRCYRWATPVTEAGSAADLLERAGIPPAEVRHVIVTHFHADHVGGLAEFPRALIHHHADALWPLQRLKPWRQVRAAFLPGLIPGWFQQQSRPIAAANFQPGAELPFGVHDLFGDGSVRLVDLPGHAPGQIGVWFQSTAGTELYAADAYWRAGQLTGTEPLGIALSLQWDVRAYGETVGRLRTLKQTGRFRLTACHDDDTAAHFNLRA